MQFKVLDNHECQYFGFDLVRFYGKWELQFSVGKRTLILELW